MLEEPITIVQGESEENQKIDSSRYLSFRSNKIPSDWSGGEGEGGGEERKIADDDVDNVDEGSIGEYEIAVRSKTVE